MNTSHVKCPDCGSHETTIANKFTIQFESLFGPILISNLLTIIGAIYFPMLRLVLPFTLTVFLIGFFSLVRETIKNKEHIRKHGKIIKDYDLHCHECNCTTDVQVEITEYEGIETKRVLV